MTFKSIVCLSFPDRHFAKYLGLSQIVSMFSKHSVNQKLSFNQNLEKNLCRPNLRVVDGPKMLSPTPNPN